MGAKGEIRRFEAYVLVHLNDLYRAALRWGVMIALGPGFAAEGVLLQW